MNSREQSAFRIPVDYGLRRAHREAASGSVLFRISRHTPIFRLRIGGDHNSSDTDMAHSVDSDCAVSGGTIGSALFPFYMIASRWALNPCQTAIRRLRQCSDPPDQ